MCVLIPGWPRVSAPYIAINGVQDTGSSVNEGLFVPCLYPHGTKHVWGLAGGASWRSDRLIPLPAPPSVCPRGWRDLRTAPEKAAFWMVLSLEQQRLIKALPVLSPPHQPPGYNLCTHNSLLSLPPGNRVGRLVRRGDFVEEGGGVYSSRHSLIRPSLPQRFTEAPAGRWTHGGGGGPASPLRSSQFHSEWGRPGLKDPYPQGAQEKDRSRGRASPPCGRLKGAGTQPPHPEHPILPAHPAPPAEPTWLRHITSLWF